jgi:error-prone DNA polymerase
MALWQLGVAAPGRKVDREGVQLALPLELPAPPKLRALGEWDAMIADYGTTGISVQRHPIGLLREVLGQRGAVSSGDLQTLRHNQPVRIGGLVVARQRPGTAKGVTFMLLEDEFGTVNLVVPPAIYERHRLAVRSEPLIVAEGKLERFASAGGSLNIVVHRLEGLDAPGRLVAEVKELSEKLALAEVAAEAPKVAAGGGDFRAVAPPVMSFTQGRSR